MEPRTADLSNITEPSLLQMLAQKVPDDMALPILEACLGVLDMPRKPVYTMDDVIAIGGVITEAAALMLEDGLQSLLDGSDEPEETAFPADS